MDQKPAVPVVILTILGLGAAMAAAYMWVDRSELARKNGELDSRIQELQKELETAKAAEESLRSEMTRQTEQATQQAQQAAMQAQQVAQLQKQIETVKNPPEDRPDCVDSDERYGPNAIYFRGSVHAGNAQMSDHCRLGQLVEFFCIENPPGSGRFLVDSKIQDCPKGSRCVEGECLR
jgi:hypothetical protein